MMERREVNYRGRVQGVGFRYTAQRIAARYAVTGYVANLPDGSVELLAEGTADELDRFLGEIADVMRENIDAARVARLAASGGYADFRIRH